MRQKRLLLSYPVYPNFLDCVVKSARRIGIIATTAIGRSFPNTTLFPIKGKSLSGFEQTAVERNQALRAGDVERYWWLRSRICSAASSCRNGRKA